MRPAFLSVQRGRSGGCQSSPGWGAGVPPPPWDSRVHLEQEEGRGRGEAAGVSWCPVSAEIMEDEAGGADLQLAKWSPAAQPSSFAQGTQPSAGRNETAGSRELPSSPNQCDTGRGQAWRRKGNPHTSPTHTEVSSQGPFTYQLSSTHQVLKVNDSVALFSQWLG